MKRLAETSSQQQLLGKLNSDKPQSSTMLFDGVSCMQAHPSCMHVTSATRGLAEVADDGSVEEMSQAKAVSLRFGIMAVVALVAALSFEYLGNVESIVGAVCSMSSSMLLPAFFFLRYNVIANQICPVNMLSLAQRVILL